MRGIRRIRVLGVCIEILCAPKSALIAHLKSKGNPHPMTGRWAARVSYRDPKHVFLSVTPWKNQEELRSIVIHECVHIAQFILNVRHRKRIGNMLRGIAADEFLAYTVQEVIWHVERALAGKRRKRLPFGRPQYRLSGK